jgi:hypothetical protein
MEYGVKRLSLSDYFCFGFHFWDHFSAFANAFSKRVHQAWSGVPPHPSLAHTSTLMSQVQRPKHKVLWCSGYHVSLTTRDFPEKVPGSIPGRIILHL